MEECDHFSGVEVDRVQGVILWNIDDETVGRKVGYVNIDKFLPGVLGYELDLEAIIIIKGGRIIERCAEKQQADTDQ